MFLKKFLKTHENTPALDLLKNEVGDLRLKKKLKNRCFTVNFVKFLRAPFS